MPHSFYFGPDPVLFELNAGVAGAHKHQHFLLQHHRYKPRGINWVAVGVSVALGFADFAGARQAQERAGIGGAVGSPGTATGFQRIEAFGQRPQHQMQQRRATFEVNLSGVLARQSVALAVVKAQYPIETRRGPK